MPNWPAFALLFKPLLGLKNFDFFGNNLFKRMKKNAGFIQGKTPMHATRISLLLHSTYRLVCK
ncbi:hypothetical protein VCHA48O428_170036 [Vibrio chagasii]|nr:hypothetical protein VCHA41O246_140045 [Vibrio chagasii]CAH7026938.1 hypothetical protein VCHA48O428_170036 [Vibrio chagasii]CAH7027288.1 hypothetical protein VCHA35O135_60049 [Vibrio chagasii]CAH7117238.1 hypothetical protein VCHA40O237_280033 [Vibrio chagasii]CAH7226068.1 hypothetical protein VCHA41O245_150035 [Vibrio chagasii]